MTEWKLADAKNRFSELVERACTEGPQIVTRNGEKVVVIVPYVTYRRERKAENKRFIEHLLSIPPAEDESEELFERLPLKARKVDL